MKLYELTYLLSPHLGEEEMTAAKEEMLSFLGNAGCSIQESTTPTKRAISYPIQGNREAYVGYVIFQSEENAVEAIRDGVKKDNILRSMLVRYNGGPSTRVATRSRPASQKREPREEKVALEQIEKKLEELLES